MNYIQTITSIFEAQNKALAELLEAIKELEKVAEKLTQTKCSKSHSST